MSFYVHLGSAVLLAASILPVNGVAAQNADALFRRLADRLVQVRLLDRASGSKSSIGSGFIVGSGDRVMTNYHVVAEVLYRPAQYSIEVADDSDAAVAAELINVDVVHDLAVLQLPAPSGEPLELSTAALSKGKRLFALGNPYDLGSSIVEGTYNGQLEKTLYEKIHFTGSLNPGMSGGPAVNEDGRVVGVNVSTAGDQVSFLVPARFAARLLESVPDSPGQSLLDGVDAQLLEHQAAVVEQLLANDAPTVRLGDYELPGELAPFLKCWGSTVKDDDKPYVVVNHQCHVEDDIYLAAGLSSGSIRFHHKLVLGPRLNPFAFSNLYEKQFAWSGYLPRNREHLGPFACTTEFVEHDGSNFKVVFCARAYRKLAGLYDAVLKLASLNDSHSGATSTVVLSGFTYENAERFARRYLEAVRWKPS